MHDEVWFVGVLLDLNEPHGDALENDHRLVTGYLGRLTLAADTLTETVRFPEGTTMETYRKPGHEFPVICLQKGQQTGFGIQVTDEAEGRCFLPQLQEWFLDARLPLLTPVSVWLWPKPRQTTSIQEVNA